MGRLTSFLVFSVLIASLVYPVRTTPALEAGKLDRAAEDIQLGKHRYRGERGYLRVPLDHARPDRDSITIGYLRINGPRQKRMAPMFFLAGGPGIPASFLVSKPGQYISPILVTILQLTDLYLIDQRGTGGLAGSRLNCSIRGRLRDMPAPSQTEYIAAHKQLASRCAATLRDQGIVLDQYNTTQSAHDIEMLRRVLRLDRVGLLGGSYGTHLGFEILRLHGKFVDRALFVGVEGPDDTIKLPEQVDENLAEMDRLNGWRGAKSVVAMAKAVARMLKIKQRVGMVGGNKVAIGIYDFQRWLAESVGRKNISRKLPGRLADMLAGKWDELASFARAIRVIRPNAIQEIMNCASFASPLRLAEIATQVSRSVGGNANAYPYPGICTAWGVAALPREFRVEPKSGVATMMVGGTLDGRTPVKNARRAARSMPAAILLTVQGMGHLWCDGGVCLRRIKKFLLTGQGRDEVLRRRRR